MIPLSPATRIFLASGATDLRKSFEGLGDLVTHQFKVSVWLTPSGLRLDGVSHTDTFILSLPERTDVERGKFR